VSLIELMLASRQPCFPRKNDFLSKTTVGTTSNVTAFDG